MAAIGWRKMGTTSIVLECACMDPRNKLGVNAIPWDACVAEKLWGANFATVRNRRPRCECCHRLLLRKSLPGFDAFMVACKLGANIQEAAKLLGIPETATEPMSYP